MLAEAAGINPPSDAFLVGMFSLLDALVDRPLSEILVELNLPAAIRAPLLGTSGPTGVSVVYEIALRYETGEWNALDALFKQIFLQGQAVAGLYVKAIAWSNEMFGLVGAEPPSPASPTRRAESEAAASNGLLAMHNALEQTRTLRADAPYLQNSPRSFK